MKYLLFILLVWCNCARAIDYGYGWWSVNSLSSSLLTPNLLWLKFNDNSTSMALDSSGNGYTGQSYYWNNNALVWTNGPTTGSAFYFNGTYTNIVSSPLTNIPSIGTASWWIKPADAYNSGTYTVEWNAVTTGKYGFDCSKWSGNSLQFGWYGGSGYDYRLIVPTTAANYPQNTWINYAITWNPTTGVTFFTNGIFCASNSLATPNTYNDFGQYVQVGGQNSYPFGTNGVDCFNGAIADLKIWSGTNLTSTQILANHTAGAWPTTNNVVTEYQQLNFLQRWNCITNTSVWPYVLEPRVVYTNSTFVMAFTVITNTGITEGAVYISTCTNPTNGTWSTPVALVGDGYGGVSGTARGVSFVSDGNGYIFFYTDESSTYRLVTDANFNITSGPTVCITATAFGNQTSQSQLGQIVVSNNVMYSLNNPFIPNHLDTSFGGQWLCQGIYSLNSGVSWQTNSGLMTWMGMSTNGAYSGIGLVLEGGVWNIFGQYSVLGETIGHACTHWTTSNAGTFTTGVNACGGYPDFDLNAERVGTTAAQQIADLVPLEVGGQTYFFYDVNANNSSAYIDCIVYNGTISSL